MGLWKYFACCKEIGSVSAKYFFGRGANWVKVSSASGATLEKVSTILFPSTLIPEMLSASPFTKASAPSIASKVERKTGFILSSGYYTGTAMRILHGHFHPDQ